MRQMGLKQIGRWPRGVDAGFFRPVGKHHLDLPRPIFTCLGRVAVEKNVEAFLQLDLPGSKVIIGDGPARADLEKRYPQAHFLGYRFGAELLRMLSSSDCMVFPSLTDTFGLVMLEGMACGLPIAAFPVTGPRDIIASDVGCLDDDLRAACLCALDKDPEACRSKALEYPWQHSVDLLDAALSQAAAA
jgi:glycosyltransferase involved in cell wall biosynthesis